MQFQQINYQKNLKKLEYINFFVLSNNLNRLLTISGREGRKMKNKNKKKTRRYKRYIRKQIKKVMQKIEKTEIRIAGL